MSESLWGQQTLTRQKELAYAVDNLKPESIAAVFTVTTSNTSSYAVRRRSESFFRLA